MAFHSHHGSFPVHKRKIVIKRDSTPACTTATLYKSPQAGTTLNATQPLDMAWETNCFSSSTRAIDIYLYAPYNPVAPIYAWKDVNYADGSYQATLEPKWWNASSTVQLRLGIVEAGSLPVMTMYGPGPLFTATYTSGTGNPAYADINSPGAKFTIVDNFKHGITKGGKAAAVLIPLLAVFAACFFGFVKWTRIKESKKRKRWSQMVDKRMSTISNNWQSLSAAGAQAAIRSSIAHFGRPASTFTSATEGTAGHAGVGSGEQRTTPEMQQTRTGASRVSRVSFAVESYYGRPSLGDRSSTHGNRPIQFGDLPPLPTRQDSDNNMEVSPTQTQGPFSLSADEIRNRIVGHPYSKPEVTTRQSLGEDIDNDLLPALSMMRTGAVGSDTNNDFLLAPSTPSAVPSSPGLGPNQPLPPVPAVIASPTTSTVTSNSTLVGQSPIGMMPLSPAGLSPDEMVRAYAKGRVLGGNNGNMPGMPMTMASPNGPAFPPMAHMNTGAMRTLYTPGVGVQRSPEQNNHNESQGGPMPGTNNPFRKSYAPTEASVYSGIDNDYSVGTAS